MNNKDNDIHESINIDDNELEKEKTDESSQENDNEDNDDGDDDGDEEEDDDEEDEDEDEKEDDEEDEDEDNEDNDVEQGQNEPIASSSTASAAAAASSSSSRPSTSTPSSSSSSSGRVDCQSMMQRIYRESVEIHNLQMENRSLHDQIANSHLSLEFMMEQYRNQMDILFEHVDSNCRKILTITDPRRRDIRYQTFALSNRVESIRERFDRTFDSPDETTRNRQRHLLLSLLVEINRTQEIYSIARHYASVDLRSRADEDFDADDTKENAKPPSHSDEDDQN